MNLKKLQILNDTLIEGYDTSHFSLAINCVMLGYFSGNDILFLAQNPGQLKLDVEGDQSYLRAYERKEYNQLNKYYFQALKSSRGTLGTFINDIYGEDWSRISITNVFKCPFRDNIIPTTTPILEKIILRKQIELLKPKIIVAIGSVAHAAIQDDEIRLHYRILSMKHPSHLKRRGQYSSEVKKYKQTLYTYL